MAPSDYRTWRIDGQVEIRPCDGELGARPAQTVIEVFHDRLQQDALKPAFHLQRDDEWHSMTFQEYYDQSKAFGKSLLHLGIQRFQGVSIIGFNSPEWVMGYIGTIFAGGIGTGIYATNTPPACKYIAEHSNSMVVLCDGQKQLDKLLEVQQSLPQLQALVVYNAEVPKGIHATIPVYSFRDFLQVGQDVPDEQLQERMEMQHPGECCTLIYTSGTTGNPKGVMISHDNLTWTMASTAPHFYEPYGRSMSNVDRIVSFLPLSHIAALAADVHLPMRSGCQVYFAQPDALKGSLVDTLKEVKPTIFIGVPRVWEKMAEKLKTAAAESGLIKSLLMAWAKSSGWRRSQYSQYGQEDGDPYDYGICHALVLSKIKQALGLDEALLCISAAAPIAKETLEFFAALDIPVYEVMGASEATGPLTSGNRGIWKIGTTGPALSGSKVKSEQGTSELCLYGRNVMMGYLNDEEQTKAAIDDQGWYHMGDCADVDEDGFVKITGRIKELIITAGGENMHPGLIENVLKDEMSILSNAVVIGDRRKFVSALFTLRTLPDENGLPTSQLDPTALRVGGSVGSSATTVQEAKECPNIQKYLDEGVARANERAISHAQRVSKYAILDRDFSLAYSEMTPTLKLKRRNVLENHKDVIESMYA